MQRNDVRVPYRRFQVSASAVHVGVVSTDRHPQPLQPPFQGLADGTEPDDGRPPAGQFPSPEALVRDSTVPEHLELPYIPVGREDPAGQRDEQAYGQFRHTVSVAARRPYDGHSRGRGGTHVNVVRVASRRRHREKWQFEDGGVHQVRLDDHDVGPLGHEALGQPGPVIDLERLLLCPRLVHDSRQAGELVEARPAQRRRDEGRVCLN